MTIKITLTITDRGERTSVQFIGTSDGNPATENEVNIANEFEEALMEVTNTLEIKGKVGKILKAMEEKGTPLHELIEKYASKADAKDLEKGLFGEGVQVAKPEDENKLDGGL